MYLVLLYHFILLLMLKDLPGDVTAEVMLMVFLKFNETRTMQNSYFSFFGEYYSTLVVVIWVFLYEVSENSTNNTQRFLSARCLTLNSSSVWKAGPKVLMSNNLNKYRPAIPTAWVLHFWRCSCAISAFWHQVELYAKAMLKHKLLTLTLHLAVGSVLPLKQYHSMHS